MVKEKSILTPHQKELNKIVKQIKEKYKPEKIILFGSFAWGKPEKSSDVDLLVVKNTKKDPLQRAYEIRKIIDPIFPFDILVFNSQEIKKRLKMGDFFIEKIINQGKVLYEKK